MDKKILEWTPPCVEWKEAKDLDERHKECYDTEKSEDDDWKDRKVWKLGCEKRCSKSKI